MDITMIGLQNAGKTSLLRVLAVSLFLMRKAPPVSTSSILMNAS
jgi:GTPase SAR1 family protein